MTTVTIAKGDGIGPEIMNATLEILKSSGAQLNFDEIELGEQVYLFGNTSGISEKAWETIRKNKILLKAPITTPQGGGYKSLNVTMRKTLGLFANVRPCASLYPVVHTKHPKMDVVIVRENEEDLYAGIEHQQTDEVVQCLKLISRPGCERIIRYAFEYARQNGRKRVSCFTKDNIMKQTDGLFHSVFKEIAQQYPDINSDHYIIDIGTALLADFPERFDVIVTPNLYGDIISDVASQITGSVGLGGSVNMGTSCAMFEAIHGSAPDLAGQDKANPSGLLQAAILMLNHVGQSTVAERIQNAWLKTLEDGIHTADIYKENQSTELVGTAAFAQAVIERLGELPNILRPVNYSGYKPIITPAYSRKPPMKKRLLGVDVFVHWNGYQPEQLAAKLKQITPSDLHLEMITNRGVKVWPSGFEETFCTDHWRCRFTGIEKKKEVAKSQFFELFENAERNEIDIVKTENLYEFDGKPSFSLGQGQ
jgi:isocitrate dehydrogenase